MKCQKGSRTSFSYPHCFLFLWRNLHSGSSNSDGQVDSTNRLWALKFDETFDVWTTCWNSCHSWVLSCFVILGDRRLARMHIIWHQFASSFKAHCSPWILLQLEIIQQERDTWRMTRSAGNMLSAFSGLVLWHLTTSHHRQHSLRFACGKPYHLPFRNNAVQQHHRNFQFVDSIFAFFF